MDKLVWSRFLAVAAVQKEMEWGKNNVRTSFPILSITNSLLLMARQHLPG